MHTRRDTVLTMVLLLGPWVLGLLPVALSDGGLFSPTYVVTYLSLTCVSVAIGAHRLFKDTHHDG